MKTSETYDIKWQGLTSGPHDFVFEIGDDFFDGAEDSPVKGGQLTAHVTLNKAAASLTLDTRIVGNATVECDRCLGELAVPVDFEGRLTVRFSDTIDDYDGETMWLNPADDTVPLEQYLYESIVLSLPYRRVHGTDAEGNLLCDKDMLARFSIVSQEDFDALELRSNTLEQALENDELQNLKKLMNEDK